jgi:hypothetical protein
MIQSADVLLLIVAAVSFQEPARAAKETLHWKFRDGEKLYYQLETVEERKFQFRNGDKSTETQRQTYWYSWSGEEADGRGGARIRVTFQRIQAHLENPSGTITVDTAAPLGKNELTTAGAELQADVFRMARSWFVFHASPHGGVPRPVPNVPRAIHMPERFTTGQLPAFVERPMGLGGEWNVKVADGEPGVLRVGTATYRVTSSTKWNNTSCLKLDSVTNYAQFEGDGTKVESDPATGTHYFKPENGRLLYSDQTNHFLLLSDQTGRSVTDSRLTYRMSESPPKAPSITVDRQLADGQTVQFEYNGGEPAYADGQWAQVVSCAGTVHAPPKGGAEGVPQHLFQFVLKEKVENLKSVSVYDMTGEEARLVARVAPLPYQRDEIKLTTEPQRVTDSDARLVAHRRSHRMDLQDRRREPCRPDRDTVSADLAAQRRDARLYDRE